MVLDPVWKKVRIRDPR